MDETLFVRDVLAAPAEVAHELTVRSIGPALVIVLEKDAPVRTHFLVSTPDEDFALAEHLGENAAANHVARAAFEAEAHEGAQLEVKRHASRLAAAERIANLRVVR